MWLVINDTTEINYGYDRKLPGVGRVGTADAQGFYLHSAMIVSAEGIDEAAEHCSIRDRDDAARWNGQVDGTVRDRDLPLPIQH